MASSQEVQEIIALGVNSQVNKRFVAGMFTLWFYDYLLTLGDEIKFAWSGKKSFVFWLFIWNRYWPVWYIIWECTTYWGPKNTKSFCDRTAWFHSLYLGFAMLISQVAITLRTYAVTRNNRLIAGCLSFIASVQFCFAVYLSTRFGLRGPLQFPEIPLEVFQICTFQPWLPGEILYTVLSLLYDCVAFLAIAFSARKRGLVHAAGVPSLLSNIVEGATIYFLVVFASQLLFIFLEFLAPESIQTIPAIANTIIVPLMVTRLMLSLKKAADAPVSVWGSNYPSWTVETARVAQQTIGGTEWATDIALKDISREGRVCLSNGCD